MIVPSNDWIGLDETDFPEVQPTQVTFFQGESVRVSELLGPDGEPLMVPFPRYRLGFDLTPKG